MDFPHLNPSPSIRLHARSYYEAQPPRRSHVTSHHSAKTPSMTSRPMSIPNVRESPPPALPPPRHIDLQPGNDPGWQWGNSREHGKTTFGHSVKPGSSLLGGGHAWSARRERSPGHDPDDGNIVRRGSSISTVTPGSREDIEMSEDPPSLLNTDRKVSSSQRPLNQRLHSERQLEQTSLEDSSQKYDRHLLSRIGGPNAPGRSSSLPFITNNANHAQELAAAAMQEQQQLASERRHTTTELTVPASHGGQSSGATSPSSSLKSPTRERGMFDNSRAARYGSTSTTTTTTSAADGLSSHRGSYDQGFLIEQDFPMDDGPLREMSISDRSPVIFSADDHAAQLRAGQKRRKTSSQRELGGEERLTVNTSGVGVELNKRRSTAVLSPAQRNSPLSRLSTSSAHQGSVSSTSSLGPRNGSFASSYGLSVASSATSYNPDRLSPRALSPAIDPELAFAAPYPTSTNKSLDPSPRSSLSAGPHHHKNQSQSEGSAQPTMAAEGPNNSRQAISNKMQGLFICECCPKKPKKFETAEELRAHESEKQYSCQYCNNRFKNKNEAERHQNSLHLRRHSWACAALPGVEAAFHRSSNSSALTDICGYCGQEFPAEPQPNWDDRVNHLSTVHKYMECNQAKKFYRADHFRQHLKHSHAGTSGKWTNMLEQACMREEPPPNQQNTPPTPQAPQPPQMPQMPHVPQGPPVPQMAQYQAVQPLHQTAPEAKMAPMPQMQSSAMGSSLPPLPSSSSGPMPYPVLQNPRPEMDDGKD